MLPNSPKCPKWIGMGANEGVIFAKDLKKKQRPLFANHFYRFLALLDFILMIFRKKQVTSNNVQNG